MHYVIQALNHIVENHFDTKVDIYAFIMLIQNDANQITLVS